MGYLLLAIALAVNAAANILLKIGAARLAGLRGADLLNGLIADRPLQSGLALFVLNVVLYAAALARLNLSVAYPIMTAGGVLIVVTFSILYLQETVTTLQLAGLSFLVVGIILVAHR